MTPRDFAAKPPWCQDLAEVSSSTRKDLGEDFAPIGRTHSAHGLRDLCVTRHAILRGAKLLFGKRFWQR